jgi:hypothetical protein
LLQGPVFAALFLLLKAFDHEPGEREGPECPGGLGPRPRVEAPAHELPIVGDVQDPNLPGDLA